MGIEKGLRNVLLATTLVASGVGATKAQEAPNVNIGQDSLVFSITKNTTLETIMKDFKKLGEEDSIPKNQNEWSNVNKFAHQDGYRSGVSPSSDTSDVQIPNWILEEVDEKKKKELYKYFIVGFIKGLKNKGNTKVVKKTKAPTNKITADKHMKKVLKERAKKCNVGKQQYKEYRNRKQDERGQKIIRNW